MIERILCQRLELVTRNVGRFEAVSKGIAHRHVHADQLRELGFRVFKFAHRGRELFCQRVHRRLRPVHVGLRRVSDTQSGLVALVLLLRACELLLYKTDGLLQEIDLVILAVHFVRDLVFEIVKPVAERVDLRLNGQGLDVEVVFLRQIELLRELEAQKRRPAEAAQVLHLGTDAIHRLDVLHLFENDLIVLLADVAAHAQRHALRLFEPEGARGQRGGGVREQCGAEHERAQGQRR